MVRTVLHICKLVMTVKRPGIKRESAKMRKCESK